MSPIINCADYLEKFLPLLESISNTWNLFNKRNAANVDVSAIALKEEDVFLRMTVICRTKMKNWSGSACVSKTSAGEIVDLMPVSGYFLPTSGFKLGSHADLFINNSYVCGQSPVTE
jgi:hypothetical protein